MQDSKRVRSKSDPQGHPTQALQGRSSYQAGGIRAGPSGPHCPTSPLSPLSNGTVDVSEELKSPPQLLSSPEIVGPSQGGGIARRTSDTAGGVDKQKKKRRSRGAEEDERDDFGAELAGNCLSHKR